MPFLPKQAANICLKRARNFLDLAGQNLPTPRVKNDLRRMGLVMAVAAVDSYMHAVILRRIADVRRRSELPKALAHLNIPFFELAGLADASIDAQRRSRTSRPWVKVKSSLQRRLLEKTFQSYDQVATAFAMAGVDKGWSKVEDGLDESDKDIKDWLNGLVHRRNQIVHEGDLKRATRPRNLQYNNIAHNEVKEEIDKTARLIDAIERVIANHL